MNNQLEVLTVPPPGRPSTAKKQASAYQQNPPRCRSCPRCVFCSTDLLWQQLHTLAPLCRYPRKKVLFLEGQPVTELMIVCGGRRRLFRDTPEGKEIIIGWLSPGDVIGYTGLFAQVPFDVSGQVEEACALRRVPLAMLRRLAQQDVGLYERLLAYVGRQHYDLRQAYGEVLSKCPPRVRLARLIGKLMAIEDGDAPESGSGEPSYKWRVDDLARALGVSRQTITGVLAAWRQDGVINGRGAKIGVLDATALKRQAQPSQ